MIYFCCYRLYFGEEIFELVFSYLNIPAICLPLADFFLRSYLSFLTFDGPFVEYEGLSASSPLFPFVSALPLE